MKITPARKAAYEILFRIETAGAHSSALLPAYEADLSPADRGLCHEITLGTLRRQLYLDCIIDVLSNGKKIDTEVRLAVRIALYQLFFLDKIPQHAAINESVNLVQMARKSSAKGFVNAVLRRATRVRPELVYTDDADRISIETSHPRWLVEKWIADLGIEKAENLASSNNENPDTAFRLLGESVGALSKAGVVARPSEFVDGCYVSSGVGNILQQMAENGEVYFQDEASQMVASSITIPAGGRFLDVCAAPGGKTGMIAQKNPDAGSVSAGDVHESRIRLLSGNLRRQAVGKVGVLQYDAVTALPFAEKSFDAVLVDAPCSGTGTIRRNPEIRYHLVPHDLTEIHQKQLAILTNASKLVKTCGSIVYSTCSLEPEENEAVCLEFEAGNSEFERTLPNVPQRFVTDSGFARTWPDRDGMDGFFAACYRRKD